MLDFSIRGHPHPPQNSIPRRPGSAGTSEERTASLAPPVSPGSADARRRDFALAIHLSAVGEGRQARERPSSGGCEREREAEKMETEGDNEETRDPDAQAVPACQRAPGGPALQAPRTFLLPPAASAGDLPDWQTRSWIPEQIV